MSAAAERSQLARALWHRLETLHAVTYFGEETQDAARGLGLDGFWVGYFALRAAPLGRTSAGTVDASFANFAPTFVRRWVPRCWELAAPDAVLAVRADAAAATLRRVAPGIDRTAAATAALLDAAIAAAAPIGRPLFAANRDVPAPDDPVAALWQRATTLREHRGDGHVAALATADVSGLEAHVLISAEGGAAPDDLQRTRGWTVDDWSGALHRLARRGLLDEAGALTDAGRALRATVERTTDALAAAPLAAWTDQEATAVLDALHPVAAAVSASGVLRYPNPIGLPPLR